MLLPVCIIDGFLGPAESRKLLDFALARPDKFEPSGLAQNSEPDVVDTGVRVSHSYSGWLGDEAAAFHAAIDRSYDRILAETGSKPFVEVERETELVAHRDGGMFAAHADTFTADNRAIVTTDRALSLVYYLNREPKAYSGGNLTFRALVGNQTRSVEPAHDRLVAFSSIAPHEVERVNVPGDAFADARFSIACWLLRERVSD